MRRAFLIYNDRKIQLSHLEYSTSLVSRVWPTLDAFEQDAPLILSIDLRSLTTDAFWDFSGQLIIEYEFDHFMAGNPLAPPVEFIRLTQSAKLIRLPSPKFLSFGRIDGLTVPNTERLIRPMG